MARMSNWQRNLAFAVLLGAALGAGGCGSGGVDLDINAPILEAAGINLSSKKVQDEDVPERAGLVVPPSTDKLPEPGSRQAAAGQQNWPQDPDKIKKQKEQEKADAEEKYCREGDWSDKASISEFNKNIGVEERCPSKLGKAISKQLGGGEATNQAKN
jgi:hypothetical protein